jgi:hypothetical protein
VKELIDLSKLPKWAQEHIHNLERQRDVAIRALNESLDNQTKSPFSYEKYECTGEESGPTTKTFFIQAYSIQVNWLGVELTVGAHDYGNTGRGIKLQWGMENRFGEDVAFIPSSYQSARLVSKEHMRWSAS